MWFTPNAAEYELLKHRNVLVAHCPQSNTNAAAAWPPFWTWCGMAFRWASVLIWPAATP